MLTWWNELILAQQIFALIAIPSTLILAIQTVMLIFGVGNDTDVDADLDGDLDGGDDGLALFSIRGIVAMLCIAGWSGVALLDSPLPQALSILIAVALGIAALFGMAGLMKLMGRLQSSGNLDYGNSIGHVAQVYLPIPAGGKAAGKVNLTLQERYIEAAAITTAAEPLPTGSYVRVVSVDESGVLVVEPITK